MSMLIGVFIPASRRNLIAGINPASSSSRFTFAAPGRVLHPPTSMISAPAAVSCSAVDTVLLCVCCPPLEKESGVRFGIAIMYVFRWGFEGRVGGGMGRERQMCGEVG